MPITAISAIHIMKFVHAALSVACVSASAYRPASYVWQSQSDRMPPAPASASSIICPPIVKHIRNFATSIVQDGRPLRVTSERDAVTGFTLEPTPAADTTAIILAPTASPATLTDEQMLEHPVSLDAERRAEEKAGKVRWLRPDYQIPHLGSEEKKARW